MTPNNIKQAYLPEGCLVVPNENGTAPGAIVELNGKTIIMLPGPPVEMKPMFRKNSALPAGKVKVGTGIGKS